jgi:hypothetical protein
VLAAWELLGRGVALDVVAQVFRERQAFVLDAVELMDEADVVGFSIAEA